MALGFNNQPVNWDNSRTILSDRSGEIYAQGIQQAAQAISQGIGQYAQKQQEKQRENDALEVLKLYGPQLGIDTSDEKALRAGVKSVGAGTLLKLADEGKQREAEDQNAIAASKEMGFWQPGMSAADAKALVAGRQTQEKLRYSAAMAAEMDARAKAANRANERDKLVADYFNEARASGKPLDPNEVLLRTGDRQLAESIKELLGPDAFDPREVTMPSGTRMLLTSRNSAVPDPGQRALQPTMQNIQVSGRSYTVAPGNRYFDEVGSPVNFGAAKDGSGFDPQTVIRNQIANLQGQITEDQTAIAQGDNRDNWIFTSRENRVREKQRELAGEQAKLAAYGAAAPVQPSVAQPAAAPQQKFVIGTKARQNGKTYQWNGMEWTEVK